MRLLEAVVADSDRAIGSLDILSAPERHRLLVEWNATGHAVADATLPELFAAQAARTPEAVAVVCGERRLSYAELDAGANRLAHHLRGLGVGAETVVGLCVERSPEMVIGLLGILKAGGAYLPLDPGYPRDRLAFMLAVITSYSIHYTKLYEAFFMEEPPKSRKECKLNLKECTNSAKERTKQVKEQEKQVKERKKRVKEPTKN